MKKETISKIQEITREFIAVAEKVNEASKKRKRHSKDAINYIKQSSEIGEVLNHEIEIISKANKILRNQDNVVLNSCIILNSNLNNQKELIKELKKDNILDDEIFIFLSQKTDEILLSLDKSLPMIQEIIHTDNEIILKDNLIMQRKDFQKRAIHHLQTLALRTLEDAENAITGSLSNLDRGKKLVEMIGKAATATEIGNVENLNELIEAANTGWHIAESVNRSSKTQMQFTEKVNRFTLQLHEDSNIIKKMVEEKHEIYNRNLELITELTVILSLEIKEYLEVKERIDQVEFESITAMDVRNSLNNLISYIYIACKDIESVASLNYDMTDSMNLNADLEKKSLDLTDMELNYFDQIRDEVNKMTEAARYAIEGSEKNIKNGKRLEKYLKELSV